MLYIVCIISGNHYDSFSVKMQPIISNLSTKCACVHNAWVSEWVREIERDTQRVDVCVCLRECMYQCSACVYCYRQFIDSLTVVVISQYGIVSFILPNRIYEYYSNYTGNVFLNFGQLIGFNTANNPYDHMNMS